MRFRLTTTAFFSSGMKLSKIDNILTVVVRSEETFTDPIYTLLSYTRAFEKDHGVRFVDVSKTVVAEEIVSLISLGYHL